MASNRNRAAGHKWELDCIKQLKPIFPDVVSARSESKSRDDQCVDIINKDEYKNGRLPFNFQCKTLSKTANYSKILAEMPKDVGINVILHKQTKKINNRFMPQGEFAILSLGDFYSLLEKIHHP